ncbi:sensor histidine kinase [Streptomyces lancefieldiae]|uniref:histidine kinase n=1 Tax=Streptomyces lancefieldiae TaxID=3075520 RepID=A0ABU3AX17_9ACTN|nr:histidine kinase [Streptomyces sp. DSM 40712]MDT0614738.1 histidine kinase [Streptomyces sp. DSM 40712]
MEGTRSADAAGTDGHAVRGAGLAPGRRTAPGSDTGVGRRAAPGPTPGSDSAAGHGAVGVASGAVPGSDTGVGRRAAPGPTPDAVPIPGPAPDTAPIPGPIPGTAPTPRRARVAGLASLGRGALLWAVLVLPAVSADRIGLNEPRTLWQQLAGLGVLGVAVALARRQPLGSFLVTAGLGLTAAPALFTVSYGPALGTFALLLGLRAERARPAVAGFVAVGAVGTARIVLVGVDPPPECLVLTCTLLFGCVFPWLGGRYWRQSRALAEAGWLRAARLEDEQRHAEERARLRERARIAQDMHDSLGHELSLLALRAAALQVAPGLADGHRAAAADLRGAAADATDHLHRIIGVLREDDEPVPLTPAGESVEELVARAAESGLPVRWEAPDTATATATPAPEPGGIAERLLHRIVREALTNAARHAPGAPVVVAVTGQARGTTVTVTNGPATEKAPPSSGGSGLLGLRAAVTSVGGDFRAGPHGDGFRVRAHVPAQQTIAPVPRPAPVAPLAAARRRVALGLGAAAGVGAVLVGAAFGWYAYTETHSVLTPSAYAKLRPGTPYDEAAAVLPDREAHDPPTERAPAPPADADCRYYRASGELLTSIDHFRLCFDERGRLLTKDVVPGVGRPHEEHEEHEESAR